MTLLTTVASLLSLGSAAMAQSSSVAQMCPESDLCYSLNIPETTVQANSQGDIYFQLSAATKYQWAALGQGSQMSGANIFVMYTSANGQNVTVSPRLGKGHVEPQHDTDAQIELLAGSGVANGMMTANVRCSNCHEWSGGTMDFTAQAANWIWAYKTGDALDSDDLTEDISQHNNYAPFKWSLAEAQGGASTNPFVAAAVVGNPASASSSGTAASMTARPSSAAGNTGSSSTNKGAPFGGDSAYGSMLITAHGALASVAFVALYPAGAILIRIANFSGLVWLHATIQAVGTIIFTVAFGIGIYVAMQLSLLDSYHPIIGIILFVVLFSQPVTGLLHHRLFKTHGGRQLFSFIHLGVGRVLVLLGLINGGLGLMLAGASSSAKIAYAVCAAVVGLVYIAAAVFGEVKMARRNRNGGSPASSTLREGKGQHRHLDSGDDSSGRGDISMSRGPKGRV